MTPSGPRRNLKAQTAIALNFERIRRLTITALFSDDILFDQIVLKGGNAMSLVHGISSRSSLDLDFSMENDFEDVLDMRARIQRALTSRFAPFALVPIDVKLDHKPTNFDEARYPWWGGYRLQFKLVDEARYLRLSSNLEQLRREAAVVGPNQLKIFSVDLSKCEYIDAKTSVEMDSYIIQVYPPAMIAVEKLRAICQQMVEYEPIGRTRRPRARDFYDIHAIATNTGFTFNTPGGIELLKQIFSAKQVPLKLLGKIGDQREYHRPDWPSVQFSTSGELQTFDFYFDFLLTELQPLHPLWVK